MKIILAILSIWIVKPNPLNIKIAFDVGYNGWYHAIGTHHLFIIRYHKYYENEMIEENELLKAKKIYNAILNLERNGAVWIAIKCLLNALVQKDPDLRYIMFSILITSLYSVGGGCIKCVLPSLSWFTILSTTSGG